LTGSDVDHATVQALGIEKSVVDGCGSKFHTDLRESNICSYRRDLARWSIIESTPSIAFITKKDLEEMV
jgi:hypothetical protein